MDVGRSSWSVDHPFVPLLPTATLMSPADSRQGTGKHGVRMFKKGVTFFFKAVIFFKVFLMGTCFGKFLVVVFEISLVSVLGLSNWMVAFPVCNGHRKKLVERKGKLERCLSPMQKFSSLILLWYHEKGNILGTMGYI